ncbi:helix-turn-helix transcriptional regulator [Neorhizobium sp. S3-V5DH]|uniref:helix-turn-helix domain-containing protein n=1 Tax=Neorhizobium sp. S3-V5DH TaxID=2485166 RepID=UPI001053C768|nr:helix-turn-helix transcriptional regulator [Neorhizobium sp. S3-V5DH]
MKVRARIAWNLRALRTARQTTQENLAVDAGVDRTTISGLERGDFNASVDVMERIAEALMVDVVDLFRVPPPDSNEPAPLKPGRKSKAAKPNKA